LAGDPVYGCGGSHGYFEGGWHAVRDHAFAGSVYGPAGLVYYSLAGYFEGD